MKPFLPPVFLLAFALAALPSQADDSKGPERFEKSIAAFEKRDAESPSASGTLLFVGSSSIRKWKLENSWSEQSTVNNGFGGSTIGDSLHYFDRLFLPHKPEAIVLYAGDNDISNGLSPEQVADDFKSLTALLKLAHPDVPVLFIAIKPSQKRWGLWTEMKKANDLVAAQCEQEKHFYFVDIATPMLKGTGGAPDPKWFIEDGLHLSDFGYEQWTAEVNTLLSTAKK
ncbi:GDSL-type esterase/lipase family protein [bacterium]|jgi:lysophospholipase L1-like esterase|nr:GDSL-type esterase/lipase family protein [Verrucomicrobiales bacterium]MDA9924457.1 GDSL-type esterase/lipase family protein [Verrucomicrobiales bacterium]MDB3941700.1 GDSL-type esterase/lipase family protein [Verrucomicrobiales bacterium]MDC0251814.1 GDSL-type esterase/lipase family protein [bacterium]